MTLQTFLVEDLDSDRKRFETGTDVVVDVALVDGAEAAGAENVVGAEGFGDGFEVEESEGDDIVVGASRSGGRIGQI